MFACRMASKKKLQMVADEKEQSLLPTPPLKKITMIKETRAKGTMGVPQICIKNHRLLWTDSDWVARMTEWDLCAELESKAWDNLNDTFNWLFVSVLTVTTTRLREAQLDFAVLILPYLFKRAPALDTEELACVMSDVHWVDLCWQHRVCAGLPEEFIDVELQVACDLNGELQGSECDDVDWTSCNEDFSECEFADECPNGQCVCPPGY